MKLHIQNLGPIKEATIDLSKRFYTFVGYNNTGKTYLAQLIWKVFQQNTFIDFLRDEYFNSPPYEEEYEDIVFSDENINELLKKYTKYLIKEALIDCYSIDNESDIVKNLKLEFIDWNINRKYKLEIKREMWEDEIQEVHYYLNSENKIEEDIISGYFIIKPDLAAEYEMIFIENLIFPFCNTNYFFPTERISFISFHKYFYKIEKERREEINRFLRKKNDNDLNIKELRELSKSSYTETTNDLLEKIYSLEDKNGRESLYKDLQEKLMQIMGGKILLNKGKANGTTNFQFQGEKNDTPLDLYLSSSSVNQLTVLYLYLNYWANGENDSFFIDEPEQNLHPENQAKLTELLIQFANRNNNRVLICTHSPLITEVINNYLVLGQLENKEEVANKLGLEKDCFLTPENTGIYFFTGENVREYKISDYGTIFEDFKMAQERVWNLGTELGEYMYHQIKRKVENENTTAQ